MKSKNTVLVVMIVILSLLVVGLGGFIFYDKVLNKKDVEKIECSENSNDVVEEEDKEEEDNKIEDTQNNYNTFAQNLKNQILSNYPTK